MHPPCFRAPGDSADSQPVPEGVLNKTHAWKEWATVRDACEWGIAPKKQQDLKVGVLFRCPKVQNLLVQVLSGRIRLDVRLIWIPTMSLH
jgi:hypothetical protein